MRGTMMRLWTPKQHQELLAQFSSNRKVAELYNESPAAIAAGLTVTRQNVNYWRCIFQTIDGKPNMARADRELKEQRRMRRPEVDDDIGILPDMAKEYRCILHIPDQHHPYEHPDMVAFLYAVNAAFNPDLIVNAGDEVDHHALSFHDSDPNLDSAGAELTKARLGMAKLHALFPQMLVCSSNHGSLAFRKAKAHGIPAEYIKSYREVLFPQHHARNWSWASEWIVQTPMGPVMFKHQSAHPTSEAAHERMNLLVGHAHSKMEVAYKESSGHTYWAATGGCLINRHSPAFAYAKNGTDKPNIGCTVILDGRPMIIPMVRDENDRWVGRL